MGYSEVLTNGYRSLLLDGKAMLANATAKEALGWGFLTLAIAGAASAIGQLDFIAVPLSAIFMVIGFIIGYSIYHFLAKFVFGGKATGTEYFNALSNASLVLWVAVIPWAGAVLSSIASLWLIVVNIFVLYHVHKLSWPKAIICGLVLILLLAIIVAIAGVAFLAFLGGAAFSGMPMV